MINISNKYSLTCVMCEKILSQSQKSTKPSMFYCVEFFILTLKNQCLIFIFFQCLSSLFFFFHFSSDCFTCLIGNKYVYLYKLEYVEFWNLSSILPFHHSVQLGRLYLQFCINRAVHVSLVLSRFPGSWIFIGLYVQCKHLSGYLPPTSSVFRVSE